VNIKKTKRPVGRPRADGRPHVTRDDVFGAAIKLIAEKGYAGTSLRMIADDLGVQAPSILNLFKTKDRILIDLVSHLSQYCLDFYQAVDCLELDPDVCVYKMIYEDTMALATQTRDVISIFYLPELHQPAFKEAQQKRAQMMSFYKKQLERGIKSGKFRASNVELMTEQLFQITETNMIALRPGELGSARAQATSTAEFAMRGLLAKPSRLAAIARKAAACDLIVGGGS
jgi:AcrR family transcriptional regulator